MAQVNQENQPSPAQIPGSMTNSQTMTSNQIQMMSNLATPQDWAKNYQVPSNLGIEKPESSGRIDPTKKSSVSASSDKSLTPLQFVLSEKDRFDREQRIVQRYKSIDSLNKADKVKALSDTNLNPYNLANPYDGLANSLHRWKTVAAQANNGRYSNEEMGKIASNYYDKMIGPMYAGMKIPPMSKDLWLKQAYSEALNYKLEDSYDNSIVHSMKEGFHSGLAQTARAYGYVTDMLGNTVDDAVALWKREATERAKPDSERVQPKPWHEQATELHNFINSVPHEHGLVSKGATYQSDKQDFWAQALPTQDGWTNHATSFVAEQAAQLPVYVAMGLARDAAKGGNLTQSLFKTPLGKRAFGYLMAGTEGLAYGTATRRQEDKSQAWRDAVGFTIFHGLFDIGGMGTKKLIDMAEPGSSEFEKLKARQDKLDLAREGKRSATGPEIYEQHKSEIANNLSVAGVTGQKAIFADALRHVENMQNVEHGSWSNIQVRDYEHSLLNNDPARWAPTLSAAKFVRGLLGDKKLSTLSDDDSKFLSGRIERLIHDAGEKLNTHAEGIKQVGQEEVEKNAPKNPTSKKAMDFYKAKAMSVIAKANPAALKMMKPEEIDGIASKLMAKDAQRAADRAERELSREPVKEATNIAKRSKDGKFTSSAREEVMQKFKSYRKEDKFGNVTASFSASSDTKAYFKNYAKEAKDKGQSLSEFFEDMDDKDFTKDLTDHFYPKALKDAKVFFESQNTKEGKQDPNFLAFMYNYTDKMPKEFGQELERRLIDTMKVQKYMSGKKPTEPQLEYYAKSMYNHVDNFLGSGRWPSEANIFRSSNKDMFNSTRWQMQLLREKQVQEKKNLKDMFSSNSKAGKAALNAYNILSKKRMEEYKTGPKDMKSQHRVKDIDSKIADIQTQTGDYERIPF